MNNLLKLAGLLLVAAIILAIVGLIVRALRWLLYVAIFVLLVAAAVRWLTGRAEPGSDRAP